MEKINDSRESILARIKASKPQAKSKPEIPTFAVAGEPLRNFVGHLKGYDGQYKLFASRSQAVAWLQLLFDSLKDVSCSVIDEVTGTASLSDFPTPASMHTIHTFAGEAIMGVGETGSLLVDARTLGDPAAALFSTDLFLLIDRRKIVAGVQHAYSEINAADCQYSSFFSGPSATADIEAVHVTGAQGEISLTALIYNCSPDELLTEAEVPPSTPCAPAIKLKRESNPTNGEDSI